MGADTSKQPADQSEADHATHSTVNAFPNFTEAEAAPVRPDSHSVQGLGSPGPSGGLPSGIDSPDRGAPIELSSAEAAPADSSSAIYHAAPLTKDASVAETLPNEEQGSVTAEEDVQPQPGTFGQGHLPDCKNWPYKIFLQYQLVSRACRSDVRGSCRGKRCFVKH